MTTCIACANWNPKATDPSLARMGFAQCDKKRKGHTMSAHARVCEEFRALEASKVEARINWMEKKK